MFKSTWNPRISFNIEDKTEHGLSEVSTEETGRKEGVEVERDGGDGEVGAVTTLQVGVTYARLYILSKITKSQKLKNVLKKAKFPPFICKNIIQPWTCKSCDGGCNQVGDQASHTILVQRTHSQHFGLKYQQPFTTGTTITLH